MAAIINSVRRAEATIKAYQGDTFSPTLTFTNAAGDALDFTDVTFKMQIRDKEGDLMQELLDGTDINVTLPNILEINTIITIAGGCYEYDLQGEYDNGDIITFLGGKFDVVKQITV